MRVKVGSKLPTIKGKNLRPSRTRNTIFPRRRRHHGFREAQGPAAPKLVIKVPSSAGKLLGRSSGKALSTWLKIRVLTSPCSSKVHRDAPVAGQNGQRCAEHRHHAARTERWLGREYRRLRPVGHRQLHDHQPQR